MRVCSFTTSRRERDARAPGALEKLLRKKRIAGAPATAEQVHGDRIEVVPKLVRSREYGAADGLLTDVPGQPLAIFTADCVPLFLAVPEQGVVGALHAGWRGVKGRILAKSLRLIRNRWGAGAKDVQVWMGPAIGPCCFQVQWDVARFFPATRRRSGEGWVVDLKGELAGQARRLGVRFLSRKADSACTMHTFRYYSFRRDRTTKRQASVILRQD